MKLLKINGLLLLAMLFFVGCSSDDDNNNFIDETDGLQLVKSFTEDDYTIDLYTASGKLEVGYNQIFIQIENPDGDFEENADLSWQPIMTMEMHDHKTTMDHTHSCPHSEVAKAAGKNTLYEAYAVFIMPSGEMDHWELNLNYEISGMQKQLAAEVEVMDSESAYHKVFASVMGNDNQNYILALVEPQNPKIGVNDMEVALFKHESDMEFPIVDHYQLKVDPRMPGMGNHSATGSEDLTQNQFGFYEGKVGFSMTGYWKINLMLLDESGEIIKGEPISDENEESSLHFKLEF